MGIDVLILNTAVVDFRSSEFVFAENMVVPGGVALCETKDMPNYTQRQYGNWIEAGVVTPGGSGNAAPLVGRAGLDVALGVNLGRGDNDGLDAQGRFFRDVMRQNHVDMSETCMHPNLPTGTTFIYEGSSHERSGITYFPNANNDFDLERFKDTVKCLKPKVLYYMYSGLSDRADANNGRDLAAFIAWCGAKGIVTVADCCTLTANPQELIDADAEIEPYMLLEPLLPELDVFFTSYDEARMIENTIGRKGKSKDMSKDQYVSHFLDFLAGRFWQDSDRTRMFGVTVSDGAYEKHLAVENGTSNPRHIKSRFMAGDVLDLVGAGDAFRSGVVSYIARNIEQFKSGELDCAEAVQMGNLFASRYIKAPLDDRYGGIYPYEKMLTAIREN